MHNHPLHNRRSIRLKGYDYSNEGLYFITLCVQNRKHLFGKIERGQMLRNTYGEIAAREWEQSAALRKNISLGEYIIMPNHMHGIISIDYKISKGEDIIGKFKSPSNTLGAIIREYKGATTKQINILIREEKGKLNTGTSQSTPPIAPNEFDPVTGVLQYAPKLSTSTKTPNEITPRTGVSQYAPPLTAGFNPMEMDFHSTGSIWQRNYYENIIRNERAYHNISAYIINNPQKWEEDKRKRQ